MASRETARSVLPDELAPRKVPEADPFPPSVVAGKGTLDQGKPQAQKRKAGTPLAVASPDGDFKAQLGSQPGVLGRYDGVTASRTLGGAARLNVLGGFPLGSSRFDVDKSFYALSLDVAPLQAGLAGRIFGVQQRIDAEQQRQALGGQLGLDYSRGFGLVSVDYDVDFRDVGQVSVLTSTRLDERTTLNALVDTRRYSSGPAAYATVQSQPVANVGQLLDKLAQSEVGAPTFDASAQTRTVAVGASRKLTQELQLAADVTLKEVLPDVTMQGTPAPTPQAQLDYSLKATWKDLLIASSSTSAGLSIAESAASRRYTGSLGGRYPLLVPSLRFGPDLAFELDDAKEELIYKPSLRFEYLQSRLKLDFQMGLEIKDVRMGGPLEDPTNVFYKVGYKYEF